MTEITFHHAIPIFRVADFDRSAAYYTEKLGFSVQWRDGNFGCVSRGDAAIMLSEGTQGCANTWTWLGVSDADALHEELVSRGAHIRTPPTNYPWGSREMHVFDVDGHVIRFGSGNLQNEPMGAWLDENGVRWMPQSDGSWARVEQ